MSKNDILLNHKNGNLTEHALHIFKNNNNSKVTKKTKTKTKKQKKINKKITQLIMEYIDEFQKEK